jgi:hypothetical protein
MLNEAHATERRFHWMSAQNKLFSSCCRSNTRIALNSLRKFRQLMFRTSGDQRWDAGQRRYYYEPARAAADVDEAARLGGEDLVASDSRAARMTRSHSHNAVFMDELLHILFRYQKTANQFRRLI